MAITGRGSYQHEIDDYHANTLRVLMKIEEGAPFPDELQRHYWKFRHLSDRIGYHINDGDLIRFVMAAKMEPGVERPYSFLDVAREGKVVIDSPIEAKWRAGEWMSGTYKGSHSGEVLVVLDDGTGLTRSFYKADVRLPEEKSNG